MRYMLLAVGLFFATTPAMALPTHYGFIDVHEITTPLAPVSGGLNLRPSIADNRSVVFKESYFSGITLSDRILVVESDGTQRVVADESGIGSFNALGSDDPGISNDGRYVAFTGLDGNDKSTLWRRDLSNNGLTRIAGEGDVVSGIGTIGTIRCEAVCNVQNHDVTGGGIFGEPGEVLFATTNGPEALIFGSGGALTPFVVLPAPNRTAFESFRQQDDGYKVTILTSDTGTEFVIAGIDEPDDSIDGVVSSNVVPDYRNAVIEGTLGGVGGGTTAGYLRDLPDGTTELRLQSDFSGLNPPVTAVSDAGIYDGLDKLSITRHGDVVFEAGMEIRGQYGIFTGPDAAQDRLIGRGDVLFGQVVTDVALQEGDAMNGNGDIAFGVALSDGSRHVVRTRSFGEFIANLKGQLALTTDGTARLATQIASVPSVPIDLSFELDFLAGSAALEVLLGDHSLGVFREGGVPGDGLIRLAGIDPSLLRDLAARLGTVDLAFILSGPAGSALTLDNVSFTAGGTALVRNGDFESGYLEGWTVDGTGGGTAFLAAVAQVPLAGSGWMFAAALAGFAAVGAQRHRARPA